MSTIWTPSGEHRPHDETPPAGDAAAAPTGVGAGGGPQIDEAELREALTRLVQTPVAAIVADHAIRLHELAVLHLGLVAERADSQREAALAIDAMAALVEGLGDRLGDAAKPLADALAQLRLAYVQVTEHPGGAAATPA